MLTIPGEIQNNLYIDRLQFLKLTDYIGLAALIVVSKATGPVYMQLPYGQYQGNKHIATEHN